MKIKSIILSLFFIASAVGFGQMEKTKKGMVPMGKPLVKVSIMYPYAEGHTFDIAYYESKHMPMVAGYLGSNLIKYTIEKGLASGIPNTPLPFMAIGTFYIKDLEDYKAAIAPNREAIRADFPNYTNIRPVILISEVVH